MKKCLVVLCCCLCMAISTGCSLGGSGDDTMNPAATNTTTKTFTQTNLVGNSAIYGASRVDAGLTNAWGIAVNPSNGYFWITANHSSTSVVYDANGAQITSPVWIPSPTSSTGGAPTGQVYNSTTDFVIPGTGSPAAFIFVGEDGIVSAWNTAAGAYSKVVATGVGVYKGVALAADSGVNFLYCANFNTGKVDVYDTNYAAVTSKAFADPTIPAGYAPFNIKNLGGLLYVSYAKQKASKVDDEAGAGNGYINIFNPNGTLISRFTSQGSLNSPWGMAVAPTTYGDLASAILVGNFGDGKINAYNTSGTLIGQVKNSAGSAIVIDGLWEITFTTADPNKLYFTAGPNSENDGLFGFLM